MRKDDHDQQRVREVREIRYRSRRSATGATALSKLRNKGSPNTSNMIRRHKKKRVDAGWGEGEREGEEKKVQLLRMQLISPSLFAPRSFSQNNKQRLHTLLHIKI